MKSLRFLVVAIFILISFFSQAEVSLAVTKITRSLELGSSGSDVIILQDRLKELGYMSKGVKSVKTFGPSTDVAVKNFQKAKGLPAKGLVGPATTKALFENKPVVVTDTPTVSVVISEPTPTFSNLTSIFYYRETSRGLESFKKNIKTIDIIAPQTYAAEYNGIMIGEVSSEVLALAKQNGVKVMPLIVNDGFSEAVNEAILASTTVQDLLLDAMVVEAKKYGYWGWQFDFEQLTSKYRDPYSAFMKRAAAKFKPAGLALSVAVFAQTSDNPNDYVKDLWNRVIGAYDYKALGQSADIVSIMSYDDPHSDGPVAGLPFQKKVLDFTLTQMPASKVSLGVPFYWWKWEDERGKIVDIGGYQRVKDLFDDGSYLSYGFSSTEGVPWVKYQRQGKLYTLWYENVKSFSQKLELAQKYGVQGFSAWVLGLEDPKIHTVLQTKAGL